jgi:Ca2+-binding EF-hand superfamily protein
LIQIGSKLVLSIRLPSRAPSQPSESSELSQSGKIRQIGRAREFPDHLQNPSQVDKRIDHILGNLKRDLLRQGLFSILRFAKHLKVTPGSDQIVSTMNHSRKINLKELSKTFRDMNIEINEADIRVLFEYLDRERKHQIVFDAVVELVKGPMSENRVRAVEELFARLDSEMKGYLTIDEFSHLYCTNHHPAVVSGRKTHKNITDELIESFADYLTVIGVQGRRIDIGEFVDYFTYLSPSISEDHIFETQLQEAWRPVRYFSKHTQQKPEEPVRLSSRQKVHPNANPSRPSPQSQDYFSGSSPWERLREQLLRRGMKTAISLRRQLFLMDDNEDLHINSWEFYKALKDFRLNLSESEVMNIYNGFIRQKTDELHIPTFMQAVLGQVSAHRNGLVAQTFSALDGQNQGHITLTILRQSYSARQHPDVVNGSKNDEEATEVFFELFDTFHNTAKGQRKEIVTRKEFTEFFSYLSPFVSEDRRFESILDCCVANTTIPNTNPIRNTAPHDNHVNHSSRLKRVQSSQTIHKKPFSDANDIITERNTTRFGVVAPFGVDRYNHYKTSYNTFHSNSQKQMVGSPGDKDRFAAGVTSWPGTHYVDPRKLDLELKYQQTLERMASALKARGVKGFLGLLESFKKADPRKTGLVDFGGFCKGTNELN